METLTSFLGNLYVKGLMIVICFFLLSKIISFIFENYFKKWLRKSNSSLRSSLVKKIRKPFLGLMILIGLRIASKIIDLKFSFLGKIITSILIIFLVYFAYIVVDLIFKFWSERFKNRYNNKTIDSLTPLFEKAVLVVLAILGLIWVLNIWQLNIAPILAGLGIVGFILGFAMQDILKNVFGGLAIILDKTVEIGETIQLDSGEIGAVQIISVRSTKIKTTTNELLTVPNGKLADMKIKKPLES